MTLATADGFPAPMGKMSAIDLRHFIHRAPDGVSTLEAVVAGIHCGSCVNRIESALRTQPGVISARANLTSRQLTIA